MNTAAQLLEDPPASAGQIVRRYRLDLGGGKWLSLNTAVHTAGGGLERPGDEDIHALRHALEEALPPRLRTPIDPAEPIPATAEITTFPNEAAAEDWGDCVHLDTVSHTVPLYGDTYRALVTLSYFRDDRLPREPAPAFLQIPGNPRIFRDTLLALLKPLI